MSQMSGSRLAGGVLLLVCLWIAVYWAWQPSSQRVSIDRPATALDPVDDSSLVADLEQDASADIQASAPAEIGVSEVLELTLGRSERPPSALPASPTGPVASGDDQTFEYIVRRGDTFESIAEEFLGDRSRWTQLARANPLVSPDRVTPGAMLRIPAVSSKPPEPQLPASIPRAAEYVVSRGDSLSRISQRVYGSARYTDALFAANRDRLASPDALRVGQVLLIPPIEVLGGQQ